MTNVPHRNAEVTGGPGVDKSYNPQIKSASLARRAPDFRLIDQGQKQSTDALS
jgi:hypothetical protein